MRKIIIGICSVIIAAIAVVGCSSEHTTYNGGNYVMFADTMNVFPVQNSEELFNVTVAATKACDYDRNVAVEVLVAKSNAIEGKHYNFESQTVVIKAGTLSGNLQLSGMPDNIEVYDSLGITLRLVDMQNDEWDLYPNGGQEANVIFRKACPFDIEVFTGYCTLTSSFFKDYMPTTTMRLLQVVKDEENENSVIFRNFFYNGYDLRVRLDNENILYPDVYMDEHQAIGNTAEAFGTIYGDGKMMSYMPSVYTSYFSSCEEFMVLYLQLYVANVGTIGTYMNAIKFITDEEAEFYKKQGY